MRRAAYIRMRPMAPRSLLKYPSPMCGSFCESHGPIEFRSLSFRSAPQSHGAEGWVGGFMCSARAVSGYETG
jgi:hypothetical protein